MFDVNKIRADFPILTTLVHGNQLVYFDNGATTQKPLSVIECSTRFYADQNSNVHRGAHYLSSHATDEYEKSRKRLAEFMQVDKNEIVWTKGATEAINLVAHGLTQYVKPNDVILISELEHHANIVPWQQLALRTGATLKAIPVTDKGIIDEQTALQLINELKPKVFAIAHASNGLGNIQPVERLLSEANKYDAITLVDGAQAFSHLRPQPRALGCDFYVGSAHKSFGPTGLGFLYGRYALLNSLAPYQCGGEMIAEVTINASTFNDAPSKFEAGTPNIAGVIAFAESLNYLCALDHTGQLEHERRLFQYLVSELKTIENVELYGDLENNIGTVSFNVQGVHPLDVATLLDQHGIAVRNGHHCNQPLMTALKINGTVRVSLACYNTLDEIAFFINALRDVIDLLSE